MDSAEESKHFRKFPRFTIMRLKDTHEGRGMETTRTLCDLQFTTVPFVFFLLLLYLLFFVRLQKHPSYFISFKVMETLVIVDFCPCLKFNFKEISWGGA